MTRTIQPVHCVDLVHAAGWRGDDANYGALLLAVVVLAVKDIRTCNQHADDAQAFLTDADDLLHLLEIDPSSFRFHLSQPH